MSATFQPPTAADVLARLASDPAFAAVVAEFVSADVTHATTYMTAGTDSGRSIRALIALHDAFPGAAAASTEQCNLYRAAKAAKAQGAEEAA